MTGAVVDHMCRVRLLAPTPPHPSLLDLKSIFYLWKQNHNRQTCFPEESCFQDPTSKQAMAMGHMANIGTKLHFESTSSWLKTTLTHVREVSRESPGVGVWIFEFNLKTTTYPLDCLGENIAIMSLYSFWEFHYLLSALANSTESYFNRCGTLIHWGVHRP